MEGNGNTIFSPARFLSLQLVGPVVLGWALPGKLRLTASTPISINGDLDGLDGAGTDWREGGIGQGRWRKQSGRVFQGGISTTALHLSVIYAFMSQSSSCNPCVTTKKPQLLACYNNESGTGHKVSICIEIITDPMKVYQAREVPLNLIPALPALHSFRNALPPTAINREDKSIVPTSVLGLADAWLRPKREDKCLSGAKNGDKTTCFTARIVSAAGPVPVWWIAKSWLHKNDDFFFLF